MTELTQKRRFTETLAYLNNPHRGCCTFQHFNGDKLFDGVGWDEQGPFEFPEPIEKVIKGYLPTSVSYCRWFWNVLEPEDGVYDFSFIEEALTVCRRRGQKMVIRLMPFGSSKQPQIPEWYVEKYPTVEDSPKRGVIQIIPDPESKEFLQRWGALLIAFAEKFDDNPLLEGIDIAFIGPWGEGAGSSSDEQVEKFVDVYGKYLKNTLLISQLSKKTYKFAKKYNAGWRVDCFGDLKGMGSKTFSREMTTCHMYDSYPESVVNCDAQRTWETAPVFMETCSVPMVWKWGGMEPYANHPFDIDFIIEQGYKYHTTYFMPKYTYLPDEWIEKLEVFCRKIGYRYMYHQVVLDKIAKVGGSFNFTSWIENIGVAPIYVSYDLAVRLRQGDNEEIITLDHIDIRKWLPGDVWLDENINIPSKFEQGLLEVSIAIVNKSKKPAVRFAVNETFKDYWLCLGDVCLG